MVVHGHTVGRDRVARLMRDNDLRGKRKRGFRNTTQSNHRHPIAPNVLEREFTVAQPSAAWVGDITYIWTLEGWLYLAVILDLYSRRVVVWAMSNRIDQALTLRALRMALDTCEPGAGLVHHTDRASQYAANDYRTLLKARGITCSMSRKGNCWDTQSKIYANVSVQPDSCWDL
jgi:putative transposase